VFAFNGAVVPTLTEQEVIGDAAFILANQMLLDNSVATSIRCYSATIAGNGDGGVGVAITFVGNSFSSETANARAAALLDDAIRSGRFSVMTPQSSFPVPASGFFTTYDLTPDTADDEPTATDNDGVVDNDDGGVANEVDDDNRSTAVPDDTSNVDIESDSNSNRTLVIACSIGGGVLFCLIIVVLIHVERKESKEQTFGGFGNGYGVPPNRGSIVSGGAVYGIADDSARFQDTAGFQNVNDFLMGYGGMSPDNKSESYLDVQDRMSLGARTPAHFHPATNRVGNREEAYTLKTREPNDIFGHVEAQLRTYSKPRQTHYMPPSINGADLYTPRPRSMSPGDVSLAAMVPTYQNNFIGESAQRALQPVASSLGSPMQAQNATGFGREHFSEVEQVASQVGGWADDYLSLGEQPGFEQPSGGWSSQHNMPDGDVGNIWTVVTGELAGSSNERATIYTANL
jgi:hypothetical protein